MEVGGLRSTRRGLDERITRTLSGPAPLAIQPDFLRLSLALLIVIRVSQVHQFVPGAASLRPVLVLLLAIMAYSFLRPSALTRDHIFRYWWSRAIAVIAVQACLSAAFGISIGNSGQFILFAYSMVLGFAVLLILAMRSTADLIVLVLALVAGTGLLAGESAFLGRMPEGATFARFDVVQMFDSNDMGLIFVSALPLVVALLSVWKGWRRWTLMLVTALIGVSIARTGSRGGFLALLVSGCLMLILTRGVSLGERINLAAVVVVALIVAAPTGYFKKMRTTFSNPESDYNWTDPTGRREVGKRGLGYMMQYPVFGVGIYNFGKAECTISERMVMEARFRGVKCSAPHNTWIEVGAELGVPGLIGWVVLMLMPSVKLFRLSRRLPLSWRTGDLEQRFLFASASGLPIALVGFMVGSSFLSFAWTDLPYQLVIFSGTTYLFASRRLRADAAQASDPSNQQTRLGGRLV